jgi:hypothetical protein
LCLLNGDLTYPSDEEYESEQENDDPQDEEENDDPQDEEEDDPQEEEMPDDDGSPAHSAHAEEPDSLIHPLEPVSLDHPFSFDSPPGSPVASDASSEISVEHAELGETGRMWTRITAQGERISRLSDRLEMIIGEFIADLRVDMTTIVDRTTAIRRGMRAKVSLEYQIINQVLQ